ncbi:MAG: 23S rRNA (adenine(2503)-C(2))-methyltransferase RlmN [Mycoplasmataceae bacterium]|jgi:23S rRNA (adenine2503-C2)-methyltransferase|nr:23S rRNA (adenine(2503)-C(2))-methyltransferase RlmN [Mycoplasmataceae bacterium]
MRLKKMVNKISIYSLTLEQLTSQITSIGLKKHNAIQIYQWLYQKNASSFDEMSNIAKSSREILKDHFTFCSLKITKRLIDEVDETTKFLFELHDGQLIETVLMKFDYGYSVCISSQVGCNMGCKFCASGLLKKIRDLSVDEIVMQYVETQKYLNSLNNQRINNMVIMGIGEPFDNYDNIKNALSIFNNHYGIAVGNRHITISTCGIVPKIEQFPYDFPQVNLAISLHAPNDKLRSQLMPINNAYNLDQLMKSIKKYLSITNRRISFEYILLKDINDSDDHAKQLGKLLEGMLCYVNIIVYNNINEHDFQPSDRYKSFMNILKKYGVMTTKRLERGTKINAACGQLRAKQIKQ